MKCSVALCAYNGERFLNQQIESILSQTLPLDEIIICDDKSTDGTVALINNFLKQYPDKIKFVQNAENVGAIKSFERCIKECSGDIVFLSDQDDVWHEDKVARMLSVFKKDPKALLVFSDGDLIDENGNGLSGTLWSKWNFTSELQKEWQNNNIAFTYLIKNHNKITGATVAFRKELKGVIFPFELPATMWHDTWLGIIAAGNGGLRFITEPLIHYRVHNNQQIGIGNGTSLFSGDKSYSGITYEYFQNKVEVIFPGKVKLIYNQKLSLFHRGFNKVKRILKEHL